MTESPTLAALFAERAAALPDVRSASSAAVTEWSREGVVFATLAGQAAELRLDPAIASAAIKTPDTSHSTRGMPWVRFAPRTLDGHAIDRATAWFDLAYRRASA
jgi:hypothetical protein